MPGHSSHELARQAEAIYQELLKSTLEKSHLNAYVAIEPTSGNYFLGETLNEALGAARKAYPERLSHVMRVGHQVAVYLGKCSP